MKFKPLPAHILLGVCGECNDALGIISQDSMYGEGMMEHMDQKEHRGMHIVSVPKKIIQLILDEFREDDDEPDEDLLSPS